MWGDLYQYSLGLLEHWWVLVTGGFLVALDSFAHTYVKKWREFTDRGGPWRRRIEIAFILGSVVWAGFQAWQDEHGRADKVERQRESSQHWLQIWSDRAKISERSIHGKGGYEDQVAALKNLPPKVVTKTVPVERQVFIPTGGAIPRSRFANTLQGFYGQGADIVRSALQVDVTDVQLDGLHNAGDAWVNVVVAWIEKNMGVAAAQKFVKPSGKPGLTYKLVGNHKEGAQENRDTIANKMNGWLDNLQEIMNSTAWDPP